MFTITRRKSAVLAAGTACGVLAAGAAWAFWGISGTVGTSATAGRAVDLTGTAVPYPLHPLYPGTKAPLRIQVRNDNSFPVSITRIAQGSAPVQADPAHAAAGCITTGVGLTESPLAVAWNLGRNDSTIFMLDRGVTMTNASDSACQGATFTIPVVMSAVSR